MRPPPTPTPRPRTASRFPTTTPKGCSGSIRTIPRGEARRIPHHLSGTTDPEDVAFDLTDGTRMAAMVTCTSPTAFTRTSAKSRPTRTLVRTIRVAVGDLRSRGAALGRRPQCLLRWRSSSSKIWSSTATARSRHHHGPRVIPAGGGERRSPTSSLRRAAIPTMSGTR